MKFKRIFSFLLTVLLLITSSLVCPVISLASDGDVVLFEEDFDDYDIGVYKKDEISIINTDAVFDSGWTSDYEVKQTESGRKYLKITFPYKMYTGGGYKAMLPERITAGTIVVEMSILTEKYTPNLIFKYLQADGKISGTETGKNYELFATSDGVSRTIRKGVLSSYDTTISTNGLALDDEGFWNLRMVYTRPSTFDNWSLTIYNAYNGEVIASNPSIDPSEGIDITGIRFVDMYAMKDSEPTQFANITDMKIYIPSDVTVSQSSEYDSDEGKVIFTASEKLLKDTVNEDTVIITSPSGEKITGDVYLSDNGTDIIVSFEYGLPESGTYTLTAEGIQTARNISLSFTESFEGTKAIIPFVVTDVSPDEGIISSLQKNITLTFTKEPDDSLLRHVSLKKANGDDIPGLFETQVNGKDVIISFGKLNPGDYVLTVGTEFADEEDGITLGEDYIINYTVEEPKSDGEDYESDIFVIGTEFTAQQLEDMSENLTYNASGKYIIDEVNGDKVLSVQTHAPHSEGSVAYVLPNAVTDGASQFNLKIKGSGNALARHVLRVYGNSGNVYLLSMNNGSDITLSTNTNNAGGAFCDDAPSVGEDGFFDLKLCLTAGDSSEDWLVEVFDMSETERLFYSSTISRSKLSDITKISAGEIWPVSDAEIERSIIVSEMRYSHKEFASVTQSPEEVLPTDETLVFKLNDDISADEAVFKLISAENTEINCECTYSEIERKLYVKPQSFLEWGETYILRAEGVDIKPYTFTVSAPPCTISQKTLSFVSDGETLYDIPETGDFNASVNVIVNAPSNREVLIALIGYDADGYPVKICYKNAVSQNGIVTDTLALEGLTAPKCKTLQCFIWEKTSFGYKIIK